MIFNGFSTISRGPRASCGRRIHGKPALVGLPQCFGCGRHGSRDGSSNKWKHVGSTPYWAELGEWSSSVGQGWPHHRDLQQDPFKLGECICCRPDCVAGMYQLFKQHREQKEKGSLDTMKIGQSSPMGRYPSTSFHVRALLAHTEMDGEVLDCCGAAQDAVRTVLTSHGLRVSTNDFDPKLTADSHMDASTDAFCEAFSKETRRPDWIVSSPPYKNGFPILKQALRVARVGVAFKLRVTFLEPTKMRGRWLQENPPDRCSRALLTAGDCAVLQRLGLCGKKCRGKTKPGGQLLFLSCDRALVFGEEIYPCEAPYVD